MAGEKLSKKKLAISTFLEIAIGQSPETAVQFLKSTRWKLDEALQLFFAANEDTVLLSPSSSKTTSIQHTSSSGVQRSSSSSHTISRETPMSVCERSNADDEVSSNRYSALKKIRVDDEEDEDISLAVTKGLMSCSTRSLTITKGDPVSDKEGEVEEEKEKEENEEEEEEDYKEEHEEGEDKEELVEDEILEELETTGSNGKTVYPPLPDEPKGDSGLLCRVRIRLPDGQRVLRSFLRTDKIQILWSFCSALLEEGVTRSFHFIEAIPGVSKKKLEYDNRLSFDELSLSNSMISMVWD